MRKRKGFCSHQRKQCLERARGQAEHNKWFYKPEWMNTILDTSIICTVDGSIWKSTTNKDASFLNLASASEQCLGTYRPVRSSSGPLCPPCGSGSMWQMFPFGTPGIFLFSFWQKTTKWVKSASLCLCSAPMSKSQKNVQMFMASACIAHLMQLTFTDVGDVCIYT